MITVQWVFPQADEVVMDFLEDSLDPGSGVWVGSWHPEQGHVGPKVIVTKLPSNTYDGERYGGVEIVVEAPERGVAKSLAVEISERLNELVGQRVRHVLVDDVIENAGPQVADNIDSTMRTYNMVYTLGFRKQLLHGGL